jgi:hypothetical protein
MSMLDEIKANGHGEPAWDRLAKIERRLGEIAATGEQRIAILRDAIGNHYASELAQRDDEIATLKKHIADLKDQLQQKTTVDRQVAEIATRLEERQARRDEAKRGPQGLRGLKGDKGDRGARGRNGITKTVKQVVTIKGWLVDSKRFTARAQLSDGTFAPVLNLRGLFEEYHAQVG